MPRTNAGFREADVKRALKGAASAGMKVSRVELDPNTGCIVLMTGSSAPVKSPATALDQWLESKSGATD